MEKGEEKMKGRRRMEEKSGWGKGRHKIAIRVNHQPKHTSAEGRKGSIWRRTTRWRRRRRAHQIGSVARSGHGGRRRQGHMSEGCISGDPTTNQPPDCGICSSVTNMSKDPRQVPCRKVSNFELARKDTVQMNLLPESTNIFCSPNQ